MIGRQRLIAIVAMTPRGIIGRGGKLPWHLPEDLAYFKRTTQGHPIVMGRKTYDSIGRPLPRRRNIVLTRDRQWSAPGVEVIHSPRELEALDLQQEIYLIGGAEIYRAFVSHCDELRVSWIYQDYEGDTSFPDCGDLFPRYVEVEKHPDFEVRSYAREGEDGEWED